MYWGTVLMDRRGFLESQNRRVELRHQRIRKVTLSKRGHCWSLLSKHSIKAHGLSCGSLSILSLVTSSRVIISLGRPPFRKADSVAMSMDLKMEYYFYQSSLSRMTPASLSSLHVRKAMKHRSVAA